MNDHYTGFVRFGFRDYDPRFGRFTAKDPIGDTGGDHDLWEYCVDDPVGRNDPSGLISAAARVISSSIGSSAGGLGAYRFAFPKKANAPEEIIELNKQYKTYLRKARAGEDLSNWDIFQMEMLKKKDNQLRRKYRNILDHDTDFSKNYPPVRTLFQYGEDE